MRKVRAKIIGRLEYASRPQKATVTIDRDAATVAVRPFNRRREYTLPLATVAEWIVQRIIRAELAEKRARRRRAR